MPPTPPTPPDVPLPDVSVLTPCHEQAAFLSRAAASLRAQHGVSWEWVLVDDGSAEPVRVPQAMPQGSVRLLRHDRNHGLGAACATGLAAARADVVAYLPADDVLLPGHLTDLLTALRGGAELAYSGVDVEGVAHLGAPDARGLRMVQVAHRRTSVRWRTREELESDDLGRTAWSSVPDRPGAVVGTGRVSAVQTVHPGQRSAAVAAGLNAFRRRYDVGTPLRFAAAGADAVDEHQLYADLRADPPEPVPGGPHVLLVGELAYNPDRIALLAGRVGRLSGLWIDDPLGFMTVGPLPFPGVQDLPRTGWADALRRDPPEVAYCLLNWRTLPLALAVAEAAPWLPLVWHFKEAPQRCLARGDWPQLVRLWERADRVVLASAEERDWLLAALPDRRDPATVTVADGDLPRARWSAGPLSPALDGDGVHTVCLGRPIGLTPAVVTRLGRAGVHVHLHGAPTAEAQALQAASARTVHVHPAVAPPDWRRALSGYDAGWLHVTTGRNGGELARASWDDLNLPARLPTLAAAGLPVLLPDRTGDVNAVDRVVGAAGIRFGDVDDVPNLVRDRTARATARSAMDRLRPELTFEAVVDDLVRVLGSAAREAAA